MLVSVGIDAVLFYDLFLYLSNRTMITTYCRENPWLAFVILTVIASGVMGLAVHLMSPVGIFDAARGSTR